jgi:glycerol uptake facilitator-like aquaporin
MTLRQEVEAELGISPGKVGKRIPAFWIHQAPNAWRKTLKYWTAFVLGIVLGAIGAGVLVVIAGVVR